MNHPDVLKKVEEVKAVLGDSGRILVRPSGTEPLVRVMVEGPDQDHLKFLAQSVIEVIQKLV